MTYVVGLAISLHCHTVENGRKIASHPSMNLKGVLVNTQIRRCVLMDGQLAIVRPFQQFSVISGRWGSDN